MAPTITIATARTATVLIGFAMDRSNAAGTLRHNRTYPSW